MSIRKQMEKVKVFDPLTEPLEESQFMKWLEELNASRSVRQKEDARKAGYGPWHMVFLFEHRRSIPVLNPGRKRKVSAVDDFNTERIKGMSDKDISALISAEIKAMFPDRKKPVTVYYTFVLPKTMREFLKKYYKDLKSTTP
jgi:hypothetical protein